jgi:hypothetical protein
VTFAAADAGESALGIQEPRTFRELLPGAVELMNQSTWRTSNVRSVIGPPDDDNRLLLLDETRNLPLPCLGAFRNRGLDQIFDW